VNAYDVILVDCPPTLSLLSANVLCAASELIVPLQCEYYALEGLGQLLAFMEALRDDLRLELSLTGILLTMHEPKYPLANQVEQEVRKHFPNQVFKTAIPRDLALAAAPSHGQSILEFDPLSPGGLAYLAATKELLHDFK